MQQAFGLPRWNHGWTHPSIPIDPQNQIRVDRRLDRTRQTILLIYARPHHPKVPRGNRAGPARGRQKAAFVELAGPSCVSPKKAGKKPGWREATTRRTRRRHRHWRTGRIRRTLGGGGCDAPRRPAQQPLQHQLLACRRREARSAYELPLRRRKVRPRTWQERLRAAGAWPRFRPVRSSRGRRSDSLPPGTFV